MDDNVASGFIAYCRKNYNGIMNVNAIKECRLLCDFQMRKVCYSEIKQEANRVRRVTL